MIETFIKALSEKCLQANSQSARKTAINITFNTIHTRILTYYITLHPTKNSGVAQQSRPAKFNICTPPTWRGFSFALHLLMVQGFYFALLQYSPIQMFTAAFVSSMQLYHPHRKAAHRALQGLFWLLPHSTAANTRPTQAAIIPPATRWSVSQHLQHIPYTNATPDAAQVSATALL